MKIKFLGSGSAFATNNFQSNMLIEKDGKRMLIDCGGDIVKSLAYDIVNHKKIDYNKALPTGLGKQLESIIGKLSSKKLMDSGFIEGVIQQFLQETIGDEGMMLKSTGLSSKDIDAIYISHLHADHVGGLEYMGFTSFPYGGFKYREPIELIGESRMLDDLWDKTLRGGLSSIQGQRVGLRDYFSLRGINTHEDDKTSGIERGKFTWQGVEFQMVQVCHVVDGYSIVSSYGLMFTGDVTGKKVFITTDTQYNPSQLHTFYQQADVIFQDIETVPEKFKSGVHAHITEVATAPDATKAKMHPYHSQDGDKEQFKNLGFKDWVKQGDVFEF